MPWRDTLHEHFPGALEWPDLLARCNRHLGEFGITPENTLFGNVMCRDEINKPDLEAFAASWGENFDLAGLGGYVVTVRAAAQEARVIAGDGVA